MTFILPILETEEERLEALASYRIMDTPPEERFDRLTLLAAEICEAPICLISLVDKDRQWFKSKLGITINEMPRKASICQYTIMKTGIFQIKDALVDDDFGAHPLVLGGPKLRFYAGQPLINKDGHALGTLCVMDHAPKELTPSQERSLSILAKEVMSQLEGHKLQLELKSYQQFFNMTRAMLCVAAKDGYFKSLNPTFTEKLGWSLDELLSQPFENFIHPSDVKASLAEVKKLTEGIQNIEFVNRFRKKDGTYIFIHWTCHSDPLSGDLYAAGHDRTDLKNAQTTLDQFTQSVSHDLKAPH